MYAVIHLHTIVVIIPVDYYDISLSYTTRMPPPHWVPVGSWEVNTKNINQYSLYAVYTQHGQLCKHKHNHVYIYTQIYKLSVSRSRYVSFFLRIKEQKQRSAESYWVKSAASDLYRLSELLQIAANLLKLRWRDSCNNLVVLLRDLHMFLVCGCNQKQTHIMHKRIYDVYIYRTGRCGGVNLVQKSS